MKPRLILGSQSPRRKELLDKMGLAGQYEVIPSEFDEYLDDGRNPAEVAEELAYGKALWVAERNPGAWVIGSDTIVTVDGKQLAKAADEDEARGVLKMLAGRPNTVTTSIALVRLEPDSGKEHVIRHMISHEESLVYFKPYDETIVEEYIATGSWHDKAGYGIQDGGHKLVDHIEGHYDTVLGLPTHTLAEFLEQAGIQAKPVELEPPVPRR